MKGGGVVRFAIIDDEEYIRNQIRQLVEAYCEEKRIPVDCICYKEAVTFLQEYRASFDAVFMDIKMPGYNGLEAAEILRQTDKNVPLVFITNLKQYAIHGYSVDAMGFVVKPLIPYDFNVQMDKILQRAAAQQVNAVTIKTATGFQRLNIKDIFYIEVIKHKLIFHTVFGDINGWGTLVSVEEILPAQFFSRCNVCYLVNLHHVQSVDKDVVVVAGEPLKIARSRKKELLTDLARFARVGGV